MLLRVTIRQMLFSMGIAIPRILWDAPLPPSPCDKCKQWRRMVPGIGGNRQVGLVRLRRSKQASVSQSFGRYGQDISSTGYLITRLSKGPGRWGASWPSTYVRQMVQDIPVRRPSTYEMLYAGTEAKITRTRGISTVECWAMFCILWEARRRRKKRYGK